MPVDLIQPATSLGVAGFAVLIMWWMYQNAAHERARNDERLDKVHDEFRLLEREVRTEITTQLAASTSALHEAGKVMERVIDRLSKH